MGKNKNDSYARLEEEVSMTLQQTYEGIDKCMKNELFFENKELRQSYLFVNLLVCDACVVIKKLFKFGLHLEANFKKELI